MPDRQSDVLAVGIVGLAFGVVRGNRRAISPKIRNENGGQI